MITEAIVCGFAPKTNKESYKACPSSSSRTTKFEYMKRLARARLSNFVDTSNFFVLTPHKNPRKIWKKGLKLKTFLGRFFYYIVRRHVFQTPLVASIVGFYQGASIWYSFLELRSGSWLAFDDLINCAVASGGQGPRWAENNFQFSNRTNIWE